jgi:hypothetical protein
VCGLELDKASTYHRRLLQLQTDLCSLHSRGSVWESLYVQSCLVSLLVGLSVYKDVCGWDVRINLKQPPGSAFEWSDHLFRHLRSVQVQLFMVDNSHFFCHLCRLMKHSIAEIIIPQMRVPGKAINRWIKLQVLLRNITYLSYNSKVACKVARRVPLPLSNRYNLI